MSHSVIYVLFKSSVKASRETKINEESNISSQRIVQGTHTHTHTHTQTHTRTCTEVKHYNAIVVLEKGIQHFYQPATKKL